MVAAGIFLSMSFTGTHWLLLWTQKSRSTNTLTSCINSFHGAILDLTQLMLSTIMYMLFSMITLPFIHAHIYIHECTYIWHLSIYLSICCKPARYQQAGLSCAGDWSWVNILIHRLKVNVLDSLWSFSSDMKINEIDVCWHSSQLHSSCPACINTIPPRVKSRWAATLFQTYMWVGGTTHNVSYTQLIFLSMTLYKAFTTQLPWTSFMLKTTIN